MGSRRPSILIGNDDRRVAGYLGEVSGHASARELASRLRLRRSLTVMVTAVQVAFNSSRVVHPYLETPPSAPVLHGLYPRLGPDHDPSVVLAPGVVDAAAPVAPFAAGSEIVALARRAAAPGNAQWVADEADPERSFAALVAAAAAADGSGWLEWEPHDGADSVRTDPVVALTAHRHFPSVRTSRGFTHPSRVGKRWEQTSSDLLP